MKFILILSAFFMLSACATEFAELNIGKFSSEPTIAGETASEKDIIELRFNDMQLRKLQVGLVSQDVLEILGKPDYSSKQTCGKDGFFYKCAIWRYGEKEAGQAHIFFQKHTKSIIRL